MTGGLLARLEARDLRSQPGEHGPGEEPRWMVLKLIHFVAGEGHDEQKNPAHEGHETLPTTPTAIFTHGVPY